MRVRGSMLAGAVILASGSVILTGGTANAATYSISVSAIGRTGTAVSVGAHLVNVKTGSEYDVEAGAAKRVPAGTYSVATTIWSPDDTLTLAARTVTVKTTTKVAFDARKGRLARFSVDDATAETRGMQLIPLVKVANSDPSDGQWALNPLHGSVPAGQTYVIPATSSYLSLVAYGMLVKKGSTAEQPSPYRYDLVRRYTGGMPNAVAVTAKTADLAKVAVTVRSSGTGESGSLRLEPATRADGTLPAGGYSEFASLPARINSYRTPGWYWRTSVSSQGPAGPGGVATDYDSRPISKKGSTKELYRTASWGPSTETGLDGRYLWIWPRSVLTAPAYGGGLRPSATSVRLYKGSKLLAKSSGADLKVRLSTTAAWYSLKLSVARKTTDALSAKAWATWKFKARGYTDGLSHGGARILMARLFPNGLDARNTAARGSTTTVGLKFGFSSMKSAAVEASFDGGKTWKKVALTRTDTGYTFKVRNPSAAGMVSLRVAGTESKGSSITQTIINAYGVR